MKTDPHFDNFSYVNFTVHSPFFPCILSSVNVKPTVVLKLFCDYPKLTWKHVNNIPSRSLTNIVKGPQYAVTRNFANYIQADMDFRHCLSTYYFTDQVVTSCIGLLKKGPWFIFAHTEIPKSAAALLSLYSTKESKFGLFLLHPPVLASLNVVVTPLKAILN